MQKVFYLCQSVCMCMSVSDWTAGTVCSVCFIWMPYCIKHVVLSLQRGGFLVAWWDWLHSRWGSFFIRITQDRKVKQNEKMLSDSETLSPSKQSGPLTHTRLEWVCECTLCSKSTLVSLHEAQWVGRIH